MMFWKSVVGKLWVTLVLLFLFVFSILLILLLQFYHNYHWEQAEKGMIKNNQVIIDVLEKYNFSKESMDIAFLSNVDHLQSFVILDDEIFYSTLDSLDQLAVIDYLLADDELSKTLTGQKDTVRQMNLPTLLGFDSETQGTIVGSAVVIDGKSGAVFSFQPLELMDQSTKAIMKYVLIAAIIGLVLITVFAFFLLSRLTKPLRTMRDMAGAISKGEFGQKIPIRSYDEIGDLARSFNNMAEQTSFHISALQQEKENLSNILASMTGGVITFNRDGEIMLSNEPADTFIRYCYYDDFEAVTMEGRSSQIPGVLAQLFERVKETELVQRCEVSLQGHDWYVSMSPLYHGRNIRGAVAVIHETTEEKHLERLRKDFIANVSHELRTPIVMLQGYSEAIIDGVVESEAEKKEMVQIIYDESLRIGRLVNDLLDLARMESGKVSLNRESVVIGPYLQRIATKFQGLAKDKQIEIEVVFDEKEAEVFFDPDRIEQVFTNLIDNGLRHMPHGGKLAIVQQTVDKGTNFLVKDSGTGISDEELPFIFERFYKVDKARTRGHTKGTGLGLTIAKNIIEAHGGEISVSSKFGEGTTFVFFLPKVDKL